MLKFQYLLLIGSVVMVLFLSGCIELVDNSNKGDISSVLTELQPQIVEYYKTQPQSDSFTIKGRPQLIQKDQLYNPSSIDYSDHTDDFTDLTDERTLFIRIENTTKNIGTQTYSRNGQTMDVTFYQPVDDVVVVYWPEKKIVGWHRVYGNSNIPETYNVSGPDLGGNLKNQVYKYDSQLYSWIISLPGFNPPDNPDIKKPYYISY